MPPSKLKLKPRASLADFQKYVTKMVKERGFENETIPQLFMLLQEEIGEMAKALRKGESIKSDTRQHKDSLEHEVADVFIYLLDICNHCGINLDKAFRSKEEINKQRTWQ